MKRIYRSNTNAIIGGVCGGIAEYFEVDPTIVRLAWAALIFLGGTGIIAYLVAWLIIPSEPRESFGRAVPYVETQRPTHVAEPPLSNAAPAGGGPESPGAETGGTTESVAEAEVTLNRPAPDPGVTVTVHRSSGNSALGVVLIAVGGFLLARTFVPWLNLHRFWPLILIGFGIFIVLSSVGGTRR